MRVFYQVLFGVTIVGALTSQAQAGGITVHFGDRYRHHNAWKHHYVTHPKYHYRKAYKRHAKLRRHMIPCTFGLNRHRHRHHSHSHYVHPKGKRGRMNGRSISYIHGF